MVTAITALVGLTAGNFLWEAMAPEKKWIRAAERSFFQAVALGVYLIIS